MDSVVDKDHTALTSCNDVQQICLPLFERFNISYFNFSRVYNDMRHISLTNDSEWIQFFYKEDYKNRLLFSEHLKKRLGGHDFFLWSEFSGHKLIRNANEFNIDQGITIVERAKFYIDFFSFASNNTTGINLTQFYFENFDILELFIQYFKEHSVDLIRKSENEKILLPNEIDDDVSLHSNTQKKYSAQIKKQFLLDLGISKYSIKLGGYDFTASKREIQCLNLLVKGFSAREISQYLCISNRTVENHLANIRKKSGVSKISEVIGIYAKSNIFDILQYLS